MSRLIALYLPQFHTIPENDRWWGKGFTEWTNVRRAKPSFPGHDQPKIPGELGYYNLLDADIKQKQADLAREAGIESFCYYHYWFGLDANGQPRQLLEKPFQQVIESQKPDFPFCLCWANHTWSNKTWEKSSALVTNQVLMAQEYGGIEDYTKHFYSLLPAFKDSRYTTVDGKILFLIYDCIGFKDVTTFIRTWHELAKKEQIGDFYFVAMMPSTLTFNPNTSKPCLPNLKSSEELVNFALSKGFDGVNTFGKRRGELLSIGKWRSLLNKVLMRFHLMNSKNYDYSKTVRGFFAPEDTRENVFPTVMPQWDRTARVGKADGVYLNATPEKWGKHLQQAFDIVAHKQPQHQIIVIKSWNEWAEGNYLEPDQKYGRNWLKIMKTSFKTIVIATLVMANCVLPIHAQLEINEVMQSNIDCIMDDLNEFPDSWVELYNPTEQGVSLASYALCLTPSKDDVYTLPDIIIPANGYQIIYCDKEGKGLHTDFRLESGKGGNIYLFKDGQIIDSITSMKKQPSPNIAYGRKTDGSSEWGYQAVPTPGQSNCGVVYTKCLGNPVIFPRGQVFTTSQHIQVAISLPQSSPENTQIRYTLDGSEPTDSSLLYSGAIEVDTTTIIRAKLFADGYLSPRSQTESYIYLGRNMTLPVISIVTDEAYFSDSLIGIYVEGKYSSAQKNYQYKWRRPCNFEFFIHPNEPSQLNQLCETRTHGGGSLSYPQKSLDIYANKRFGTKRLTYEFFPNQKPHNTDYKSITLRNGGNDFQYLHMRDAVIQRSIASHRDIDWSAYQPAITFINGRYMGIMNIRERSNEDYLYTNYNEIEDVDIIECWSSVCEGTKDEWKKFYNFITTKGHTYQEYEQWMDCDEILDIFIMNIFYNNQDFHGYNIIFWRPRNVNDKIPMRWRMIAKDTDFGLGLYNKVANYNTFAWLYDENYDPSQILGNKAQNTAFFRNLMEDSTFQTKFIERSSIYIGDFLNDSAIRPLWDSMVNEIAYEYPYHFQKYKNNTIVYMMDFNQSLSEAHQWLIDRITPYYNYMGQFYNFSSPIPMTINQNTQISFDPDFHLSFNGISLSSPYWKGKFFSDIPVALEIQEEITSNPIQWRVRFTLENDSVVLQYISGKTCNFNIPDSCILVNVDLVDSATTFNNSIMENEVLNLPKILLLDGKIIIKQNNKAYSLLGEEIK